MNPYHYIVFVILLAGSWVQAESGDKIIPKLTMGVSAEYPPFEFKKNGEIVGFDIDLAKEIANELQILLQIQDMDFSSLIPAMQSGRIDFIASGMTVTEERKKNVDFSEIYFTSSIALITLSQSPFPSNPFDFNHKKIGVQLGTTMEKYAKEKTKEFSDLKILPLNKNPLLVQEVKAGRIDGMISEEVQAIAFAHANPDLTWVKLADTGDGYAIAFPKNSGKNNSLRDKVDLVLKRMRENGKLKALRKKWVGTNR